VKKLLSLLLFVAALDGNPPCPRDGGETIWTGRTRIPETPPRLMQYEYKCMQFKHVFWSVVAPGEQS
jgi:hypothetical protein